MATVVRKERLITAVLGWVAGYADTAGFLGLNGLFTAHVTGNLVVAGAEIAGQGGEAVWVRLGVIPVFMAAVAVTTALSRVRQLPLSDLLWFETGGLLFFAGAGVEAIPQPHQNPSAIAMLAVGGAGVFAMGVQNALMREALGTLAPTTVMTGNLTQFTMDMIQLTLVGTGARSDYSAPKLREIRSRASKFGNALFGFVLGAALGAVMMRWCGFWSILLPAGAIALLAIDARRCEARAR